jgi:CDP-glucose 4,6-dehydratase
MPLLGVNPYDASKVCAEALVRSYRETFGLPVVVARRAHFYGGGDLDFSRLIPGTVRSVLAPERPIVRRDGSRIRDYLYVDDAVTAYPPWASSSTGPRPRRGVQIRRRRADLGPRHPRADPRRVRHWGPAGKIDRQYVDSPRTASVLGWQPRVSLGDGLRRTVSWHLAFLAPVATSGAPAPVPYRIPGRA